MWRCPKCRSRVDDEFEVCWSCGTSPDGAEDPWFLTADETRPIVDPAEDLDAALDDSQEDFAGTPDLPSLVECYQAESTIEASFVADRLFEAGVPAVADTHNVSAMGGLNPRAWGHGPKVRVRPEDRAKADAWVADYRARKAARNAPKAD